MAEICEFNILTLILAIKSLPIIQISIDIIKTGLKTIKKTQEETIKEIRGDIIKGPKVNHKARINIEREAKAARREKVANTDKRGIKEETKIISIEINTIDSKVKIHKRNIDILKMKK